MKQVMIYKGNAVLRDVPDPFCPANSIYVETAFSCISAGTESISVKGSSETLLHKALTRPATAARFAKLFLTKGSDYVINTVKTKMSYGFGNPIGYTASGIVRKVGNGIEGFSVGDRVAVYGGKFAYHSSINVAPKNMAVKIPLNVSLEDASTGALGGIAMQGVHRLSPSAGDVVLVVGMGLIGQITTQILLAYNCSVICSDIDPARLSVYASYSRVKTIHGNENEFVEKVKMLNHGSEVDGVIFTAATTLNEPLSNCFKALRKKGTCVLVGVSGMQIDRNDIYEKEINFLISTSYGPGRYDTEYEEKGKDYPVEYVPFTEQRNIEEYLRLISENKIKLDILSREIYKVEDCGRAFIDVLNKKSHMLELIDYSGCHSYENHKIIRKKTNPQDGIIQVAIVGTGSYAKNMYLPNLHGLPSMYNIRAIMNRSGIPAAALSEQYDTDYCTNDYMDILNDTNIDMVIICTRHDSHADLAIKALEKGKDVLVEKPPALNYDELVRLRKAIENSGKIFTVGYNRRFSKYAKEVRQQLSKRKGPVFLRYLMNAGYIPYDNWVHHEGGGRIIGEGCHIVDLIIYLLGTDVADISTQKLDGGMGYYKSEDNIATSLVFKDGSVAIIEYISMGSTNYKKESMNILYDDEHIILSDYKELSGTAHRIKTKEQDKGQVDMLKDIYKCWHEGEKEVIPIDEIYLTSKITFSMDRGEYEGRL